MSGVIADLRTGYLSQGVQDQQAFEWYFGAAAHNLATLANPLFSDLQNFPDGVNLMANAAVLGLGIPLAPLTLLAGPSATFLVVELLGLALTASAWFWLFRRRLAVHPLAAAIGAGFIGFAPGMVSHANGHPNFVAQFLVPLIIDRVLRLAQGHRPVRDGVVLGLLAAWQVFIGEEVLLLTAIGLAVAGVVYLAHGRVDLRRMAPGLGIGAAVCLAIVAVPLWWQFAGPQSYTSIWHPPAGNDLAQLWGRATRSIGSDPWASAALSMNRTEENSFFGIPLLVAAAVVVVVLWRRTLVQALGAVVLVSCWLSLGEEVTLNGTATGIPGPWALLEQLPVIENVLPTRFTLVAVPALGALLALGLEEVRRLVARYAGHAGAGLAVSSLVALVVLLPVIPTPLLVDQRAPMPAFFSDGTWRDWVDEGGSVLAAPGPLGRRHPGAGVAGAGPVGVPGRRRLLRRPGLHRQPGRSVRLDPDGPDPVDGRHHRERSGRRVGEPGRGVPPEPARRTGRRHRAARRPPRGAGPAHLAHQGLRRARAHRRRLRLGRAGGDRWRWLRRRRSPPRRDRPPSPPRGGTPWAPGRWPTRCSRSSGSTSSRAWWRSSRSGWPPRGSRTPRASATRLPASATCSGSGTASGTSGSSATATRCRCRSTPTPGG